MKKPICIQSSVHVNPTTDFNHWQKELNDEREFLRLIERFKQQIISARTK
jgi:hypothetical protein